MSSFVTIEYPGCVTERKAGQSIERLAAIANPVWYADGRCFRKSGIKGAFDEIAVKDPTIVHYGGKYHMFYTGVTNTGQWQTGYASADTIPGLENARRVFLDKLRENYFCAPQVFYFEPRKLWYLVYQDGDYGAAYSTTKDITDPDSWEYPASLGIREAKGYDYYVLCDDEYAYLYNTPEDGSRTILVRKTLLSDFPGDWGSPSVAVTDTFEGVCVYKSLADGMYYLLVEDLEDNRYYELHVASDPSGPWKKVAEKWASRHNLTFTSEAWTDNISHGEIIRAGANQKMEIRDINSVDFLIQGVKGSSHGEYWRIPWDIGLIRNYNENVTRWLK